MDQCWEQTTRFTSGERGRAGHGRQRATVGADACCFHDSDPDQQDEKHENDEVMP